MRPPTLTVAMTVNNRSQEVLTAVFDSLRLQPYDRLIVVADGIEPETRDALGILLPTMERCARVDIVRPRGWLSPVRAWNAALDRADTELVMMISSETVQGPDNVAIAKEILSAGVMTVFGSARCSVDGCPEVAWGDGTPGHVLCDAAHPRPLGFVVAMPRLILRAAGGFDEGFMGGYWYDDDDFFFRVWRVGYPFLFTDRLQGTHLHHERSQLSDSGIARNREYIKAKYGGVDKPLDHKKTREGIAEERRPGETIWRHRCGRCSIAR